MVTNALKFYVRVNEKPLGPFTESKVQRMIRDGELEEECYVRSDGTEQWQLARSIIARLATQQQKEGMRVLGMSIVRGLTFDQAEYAIQTSINADPEKATRWPRWKILSAKKAQILAILSAAGRKDSVSQYSLEEFLSELQGVEPNKFQALPPEELLREFDCQNARAGWRGDPATEPQIRLLQSKGVRVQRDLTKGEASDLIEVIVNGATEGQHRRLRFYGLDSAGITKEQATDLIDRYIADHPEAEYQYQMWKANEVRTQPPISMTRSEWNEALDWAGKQSVEEKFILPDIVPGDEAASRKQLQYIRSTVQAIDEAGLQKLTKRQACSLIDQIDAQKKAFAKSKAEEYVRLHPRRAKPEPVIVLAIVGLVIAIAIVLLRALS